jgi:hypothetical protein
MHEKINLTELFIETHDECIQVHKKNNGAYKKHTIQQRYLELHGFINNSVYWARYNLNINTGKYAENCITGKYLNEIHLEYVDKNFYKKMYMKLLTKYFKITNFNTLQYISIDSFFCRNILGNNLNRNPHYSNKTGLKNHSMVDTNRVPISMFISNGTVSDSITLNDLFDHLYVDDNVLNEHCKTILADSSYSSIINVYNLTNSNYNIIMGRNKHHLTKNSSVKNASDDQITNYKIRGKSENFFSNIQRYPCLLNNYERSMRSYEGLSIFATCCMLSKKINKIIDELNDISIKQRRDENNLKKKIKNEELKKQRYAEKKEREKIKKQEYENRKKNMINLKNKIKKIVSNNTKKRIVRNSYTSHICDNKTKLKKYSYEKFQKYIDDGIYEYIVNSKIINTYRYKFAKKDLYMIIVQQKAFTNENIKKIMESIDQLQLINMLTCSFFGI